jgi:catechol 2,3-dioxygenase-like lactoylglutathione lyase family enzyme
MPDASDHGAADRSHAPRMRPTMMFHPSHHVLDLAEVERWFGRVFGRPSTPLSSMSRGTPPRPGYPVDYSTFTLISDVLLDSIDPRRYVLLGVQRYASVDAPHLKGIGWYVDDVGDAYRELARLGIRMVSQLDEIADGDDPPTAAGSTMPLFFTVPDDTGLRYEIFPAMPFPLDPRTSPGWATPPVADDDPLGIERCAYHTVLTDRPERALRFAVDAMGGEVVHRGRNEVIGATSTHVHLSGSLIEYAVPDRGTPAYLDWAANAPNDAYHSITWKVADLDRAERHLRAEGVAIWTRTDDMIVTDAATSLGVPWGFTTSLTPGDPRAGE